MKKLTIKALILSLLMLSAPSTKCTPVSVALGTALAWVVGPIIGAFAVGVVGGVALVGYKIVKGISSKKKTNEKKQEKNKKKKRNKGKSKKDKQKKKKKKNATKKEVELEQPDNNKEIKPTTESCKTLENDINAKSATI